MHQDVPGLTSPHNHATKGPGCQMSCPFKLSSWLDEIDLTSEGVASGLGPQYSRGVSGLGIEVLGRRGRRCLPVVMTVLSDHRCSSGLAEMSLSSFHDTLIAPSGTLNSRIWKESRN